MKCIRYVIKLRNGNYLRTEFKGSLNLLEVWAVDNPIDADLIKEKRHAERSLKEILSGNSAIVVLYDEDNPPVEVIELNISIN
jgi:hypothetical protein